MKRAMPTTLLAFATMACAQTATLPATTAQTVAADAIDGPLVAKGASAVSGAPGEATEPAVPAKLADPDAPWLGAAGSSRYVLVGGQQFVGVWVDVPEAAPRGHVPVSLTLTIDTSGSMEGDKIVRAREAARTLVSSLKDGDMVAIQSFSNMAQELVGPTVLDQRTRAMALGRIAELEASGATNLFEGLSLAMSRASNTPASHPVRRVVLISDGRATAGETSIHSLSMVAERGTQLGVQVTSFGVGLDYDEDALNELAVRSSGRLFHLTDASELPSIVKNELKLLQSTMATAAVIEVAAAPGVQLMQPSNAMSHWGGSSNVLRIPVGTLFAGQRREVLVPFRMSTHEVEGTRPIVSVRLHFADPTDGGVPRVQEVVVRGELTTDSSLPAEHPTPEVQALIAMQNTAAVATAARRQIAAGDFDGADDELARAETELREQAKKAKDDHDRARMTAAADKVGRTRGAVRAAKMAPPSARPAAQRSSALEANDVAMDASGF
jgi:Ca-activated chloride channel family protein